jgi:hypothetical protein
MQPRNNQTIHQTDIYEDANILVKMLPYGDDPVMVGYNFDGSLPQNSHISYHDQYPVMMDSSYPSNSFLKDAFPRSYNQTPQYYGGTGGSGPGCDFNRMSGHQIMMDDHNEFLYSARPSARDSYDITGHTSSHDRNAYRRTGGADNLNDILYEIDREYQTMEASRRGKGYHYQRNVQFVEEDEKHTKPGCIRSSFNDVLDVLFPKYRRGQVGRGTNREPVKASYPILSPKSGTRFKSYAIDSFDIPERQSSFESNGSFDRARQIMRDVSQRTSNRASELHDQLRALVQDRALRQTQQRDVPIPSARLEDEQLAESRRMLQLQIEQHQAAMTNHMATLQTAQQYHMMSPMYNSMVQNGMVNGMMNHQQLNNMFTRSTQDTMKVTMPIMNGADMNRVDMMMQSNVSRQQQQDQRNPSECTPRINDQGANERSGMNFATTQSPTGSPPRVVKVANGTKLVFSSHQQQSDASTIQSIQETVERAMRKSDAARMQLKTSKELWSQASKIRA